MAAAAVPKRGRQITVASNNDADADALVINNNKPAAAAAASLAAFFAAVVVASGTAVPVGPAGA